MTARSADDLLAAARSQIRRVEPDELERLHAEGALVVDIRPAAQRAAEGALGFGLIVERNVLEWRFDLTGGHTLPEVNGYDQTVVVVCSEGYASSLAAASLRELGFAGAGDLSGGYVAWRRWRDADTAVDDPGATRQPTRGIPGPPPPVHRSTAASRGESGSPVNRAGVTTA